MKIAIISWENVLLRVVAISAADVERESTDTSNRFDLMRLPVLQGYDHGLMCNFHLQLRHFVNIFDGASSIAIFNELNEWHSSI